MIRFEHLRLRLVGEDNLDTQFLEDEFPTVTLEQCDAIDARDVVVDDRAWRGAFDLRSLDEVIEQSGPRATIAVRGYGVEGIASQVVTRYQRLLNRRNDASRVGAFDRVLRKHEELFAGARKEQEHALETWQWLLRLAPDAALHTQLAALFHDLERLEADARNRLEHRILDGTSAAGKAAAERLAAELEGAGVDAETVARACAIVCSADRRSGDADAAVLDDADALSFLSLSSARYIDFFGVAQTRRKVAYTLSRLGTGAREKLEHVRFRPDVERLVREVAA